MPRLLLQGGAVGKVAAVVPYTEHVLSLLRALVLSLALAGCRRPPVAEAAHGEVNVPAGTLVRGRSDGRPDEAPRHEVEVSGFRIDATLVTKADFERFVERTHHVTTAERIGYGLGASEGMEDWAWERIPAASFRRPFWEETRDHASFLRPDAPVTMVTWHDAVAYCADRGARLPTEAEWELAMRAGNMTARYPWGEEPVADGAWRLNFWQGTSHAKNERLDGWVYVSPVKAYPPNALGIHDPVGNVWQWTADWYDEKAYANDTRRDPKGPPTGTKRVTRGGSWWCGACTCEGNGLYYRGKAAPAAPFNNIGFRCAR